jgi:small basic protein (TIGR04137 family)
MSIHRSLKGVDTLRGERSVLTRFERILKLSRDGKLKTDEASAYNLPKVRTKFKTLKVKKPKAEEGEKPADAAAKPVEPAKGAEGAKGAAKPAAKGDKGDKGKGKG